MNSYSKSNEVDTYNSRFIVKIYHRDKTYKDLRGNPTDAATYYTRRYNESFNTIEQELEKARNIIIGEISKKSDSNPVKTVLLINNLNRGRHLNHIDNKQLYKLVLDAKTRQYQGSHILDISDENYEIARKFEEILNN